MSNDSLDDSGKKFCQKMTMTMRLLFTTSCFVACPLKFDVLDEWQSSSYLEGGHHSYISNRDYSWGCFLWPPLIKTGGSSVLCLLSGVTSRFYDQGAEKLLLELDVFMTLNKINEKPSFQIPKVEIICGRI